MLRSVENISTKGPLNCRSLGYARDDKGESGAPRWHLLVGDKNSRFPFAMLRSVEKHFQERSVELQIPRLRSG
jgi:hypothetical protein